MMISADTLVSSDESSSSFTEMDQNEDNVRLTMEM